MEAPTEAVEVFCSDVLNVVQNVTADEKCSLQAKVVLTADESSADCRRKTCSLQRKVSGYTC